MAQVLYFHFFLIAYVLAGRFAIFKLVKSLSKESGFSSTEINRLLNQDLGKQFFFQSEKDETIRKNLKQFDKFSFIYLANICFLIGGLFFALILILIIFH